jgi:hypothetical protein
LAMQSAKYCCTGSYSDPKTRKRVHFLLIFIRLFVLSLIKIMFSVISEELK